MKTFFTFWFVLFFVLIGRSTDTLQLDAAIAKMYHDAPESFQTITGKMISEEKGFLQTLRTYEPNFSCPNATKIIIEENSNYLIRTATILYHFPDTTNAMYKLNYSVAMISKAIGKEFKYNLDTSGRESDKFQRLVQYSAFANENDAKKLKNPCWTLSALMAKGYPNLFFKVTIRQQPHYKNDSNASSIVAAIISELKNETISDKSYRLYGLGAKTDPSNSNSPNASLSFVWQRPNMSLNPSQALELFNAMKSLLQQHAGNWLNFDKDYDNTSTSGYQGYKEISTAGDGKIIWVKLKLTKSNAYLPEALDMENTETWHGVSLSFEITDKRTFNLTY